MKENLGIKRSLHYKSLIVIFLFFFLLGCIPKAEKRLPQKELKRIHKKKISTKPLIDLGYLKQLTNDPEVDARASFSPDGTKIAFHSKGGEQKYPYRQIWIADSDGSNPTALTNGDYDSYSPVFSPDGKKILFISEEGKRKGLWIMNIDGSHRSRITDEDGIYLDPSFSPDGKRIIYSFLPIEGSNYDIYMINIDGSKKKRLTNTTYNEISPSFHPEGRDIIFSSDEGGNFDIYIMNIDGENKRKIISSPKDEMFPSFSLNGSMIVYHIEEPKTSSIWIAGPEGENPSKIDIDSPSRNPRFSPNGKRIIFQSLKEKNWDIWTMDIPDEIFTAIKGRGRREDILKLRDGKELKGRLINKSFSFVSKYTKLSIPVNYISSLYFDELIDSINLIDMGHLKGIILDKIIKLKVEDEINYLRKEKIKNILFKKRLEIKHRKSSVISLINGDILYGRILNKEIKFEAEYGTIDIGIEDVKRIDIDADKAKLTLKNGDVLTGSIKEREFNISTGWGKSIAIYRGSIKYIERNR